VTGLRMTGSGEAAIEVRPALDPALAEGLVRALAEAGGTLAAEPPAYSSPWWRAGLLEATGGMGDELRPSTTEYPRREAGVVEP
jgi:hypothetical protein